MRICLFSIGSRGDIQPFIALALGLKKKGHDPILAVPENFTKFVEGYGVSTFSPPGNLEEFLHKPEGKRIIRNGGGITLARHFYKETSKMRFELRKSLIEVCENSDMVIAYLTTVFWTAPLTEKLGKKLVLVSLNPPVVPTSEFPFAQFNYLSTPWYNRLTYHLVLAFVWSLNKNDFHEFRRELGLSELKHSFITEIKRRRIPLIHCFSPELIKRPSDWEQYHQVTGYLNMPEENRKKNNSDSIPKSLKEWITNGEKPIYIGFGSIPVPNTKIINKLLQDILYTTSHRIIFCEGWSQFTTFPKHKNLFYIQQTNHSWLFPRCKAAIIHGGAGTTHAALQAGIPIVVASIFGDQPMWGRIISKKKLGAHIPFQQLTLSTLMDALNKIDEPSIRKNVAQMGRRMQSYDGLGKTLKAIENHHWEMTSA